MLVAFALLLVVDYCLGHGRLSEPPSRASAWRFGFNTSPDYNDNEGFCGGLQHLWEQNGGKCGICGDPWDAQQPRDHEIGGVYGLGVIVRSYRIGEEISVVVDLTASHKGFWEMRLCTDPMDNSEDCFKYILEQSNGEQKFYPDSSRLYELRYRLPRGVACEHCVIAWWYVAGNNWGTCDDDTQAVGCGPQEFFRACADVKIEPDVNDINQAEDNNRDSDGVYKFLNILGLSDVDGILIDIHGDNENENIIGQKISVRW